MNSFQILDSDNNPVNIFKLDMLACELWNVKSDPKQYAKPIHNNVGNWYDVIGFNIAHQGHYTNGWNNVKLAIIRTECEHHANLILNGQDHTVGFKDIIDSYKSYFDLINFWDELGYKPKQIKD